MSPVDSDVFTSADFSTTFGKIDAAPGVAKVANYSALTTLGAGWGVNQHGRFVLQLDNGALWYWFDPSGSGSWKRANSTGLLAKVVQNADVSSSATSGNGILVVQSGNITVPGGRYLDLNCTLGLANSTGAIGMVSVNLVDNGSNIKEFVFKVGTQNTGQGNSQSFDWYVNPSANSVHNYGVYIRSVSGSTSNGAGGSSTAKTSVLNVIEV